MNGTAIPLASTPALDRKPFMAPTSMPSIPMLEETRKPTESESELERFSLWLKMLASAENTSKQNQACVNCFYPLKISLLVFAVRRLLAQGVTCALR